MRGSGIKRGGIPSRLPIVLAAILSASALVRAEDWKREVSDDGKATVEYRVSRIGDDAGEERPLIEFKASLIDSAGYERCLSVMLDVSKHKIINDDEASETIRKLSETEWILYYELKIPWPLPKTDCVMRMSLSKDSADKSAEFALTAAPELAPSRGKRRSRRGREILSPLQGPLVDDPGRLSRSGFRSAQEDRETRQCRSLAAIRGGSPPATSYFPGPNTPGFRPAERMAACPEPPSAIAFALW
jgi:hypothetical protein